MDKQTQFCPECRGTWTGTEADKENGTVDVDSFGCVICPDCLEPMTVKLTEAQEFALRNMNIKINLARLAQMIGGYIVSSSDNGNPLTEGHADNLIDTVIYSLGLDGADEMAFRKTVRHAGNNPCRECSEGQGIPVYECDHQTINPETGKVERGNHE